MTNGTTKAEDQQEAIVQGKPDKPPKPTPPKPPPKPTPPPPSPKTDEERKAPSKPPVWTR